jgi:hypothetical protein
MKFSLFPRPAGRRLALFVGILLLTGLCVGVGPAVAGTRENLELAFSRAFRDPAAFRDTKLFEVLRYTPEQVKAIVEITPRPASLTVEFQEIASQPGAFARVTVTAFQVKYYNLVIDHATFSFPDIQLDPDLLANGYLSFQKAARIDLETMVSAADILRVFDLFAKARQLSGMRLDISPKQVKLNGKTRRGIVTLAFEVFGSPRLEGDKTISFQCRKMVLNGVGMPRAAISALFDHINPVFDARKTWLKLTISEMATLAGFVRTKGIIHPALPAQGDQPR